MKRLALIALLATSAHAQDAGQAARNAAEALEAASVLLDTAEGSRERVAALTHTVRAYEVGLDGLARWRCAMRRWRARIRSLPGACNRRKRDRIGQVLGVHDRDGTKRAEPVILHSSRTDRLKPPGPGMVADGRGTGP